MFCSRLPTSLGYISTFDITYHHNSFVWTHRGLICEQVVEFVVAIDEARVRFTDDAQQFIFLQLPLLNFFWLRENRFFVRLLETFTRL
ncbi:taurine catabolism dioxygenase TauD TfdA family protein [Penicillium cf. viridicatum]|uniref:Taurine catabolism dioxygenase TauD TfdA family protein n=1 Tax=Penicillium cf. viridicatum TaxID=2972119 RepID=A0A9W9MWH8_9EURO|nr:taurine catabolism dioxygenase TauD TfdA family protein [Penicillium cf. viridicatum]